MKCKLQSVWMCANSGITMEWKYDDKSIHNDYNSNNNISSSSSKEMWGVEIMELSAIFVSMNEMAKKSWQIAVTTYLVVRQWLMVERKTIGENNGFHLISVV